MGGEHVPQHDCHGLQTCRYKTDRATPRSGSSTSPPARAAPPSPSSVAHTYADPTRAGALARVPLRSKAPLCRHGGAEPGGSHSRTGLTPRHDEHSPREPAESRRLGAVQLEGFGLSETH